jgi:transposase-like protein
MKKRNQYSAEFKAKVVLEVLREEATVNEIADKYSNHPGMINRWKQEFVDRASEVFKKGPSEAEKTLEKANYFHFSMVFIISCLITK